MKGKRRGIKARLIAGLMGMALLFLSPCWGMDALTESELGELTGKTGITMGFSSDFTVKATFNSITFGDKDGWGAGASYTTDQHPGWLVLVGESLGNTGSLSFSVPAGAQVDLDVGVTGATTTCHPAGTGAYNGIAIPKSTPFLTFTLSDVDITLDTPDTVNICLTDNPNEAVSSMEDIGWMEMKGLDIDLRSKERGLTSQAFIWVH